MNRDEITAFADASAGAPRLMGLDLGTKTIGLALSDVGRQIASPLETIRRVKFTPDAGRIVTLCATHAVGGLVIGLPLNMDGSEGPRAQSSRSFARNLKPLLPLPVPMPLPEVSLTPRRPSLSPSESTCSFPYPFVATS